MMAELWRTGVINLTAFKRAFVVRTQPRRETLARDFLTQFGFTTYLPLMRVTVTHARQKKVVDRPFLPMYMFLFDDGNCDLMKVRNAPGVSGYLKCGAAAAYASVKHIDEIREREQVVDQFGLRRIVLDPPKLNSGFMQGETLRVDSFGSAFDGFNVLFDYQIDEDRVSVFLSIFGQMSRMTMDRSDLVKI